jgi:hypothetical protein
MIRLILFVSLLGLGSVSAQFKKSIKKLPDTGQTTGFTPTFGEDNDFTISPPFFQNVNAQITLDTITDLMWQRTDGGEMTWENALLYADTATLGGYTDWRLPTALESFSILNHQFVNPSIDVTIFTNTGAEYWWTSEKQWNDSTKIWVTNAGGGIGNHRKNETISDGGNKKFHVRLVRAMYAPPIMLHRFEVLTNRIVSDSLTGLFWQKTAYFDSLTWEQALLFADSCTLGGFTDWRLPNIKELQSISDPSISNPSFNSNYFTNAGSQKYWSSTSLPNFPMKAWILDNQFGLTTYDVKSNRHRVILVRGNTTLMNANVELASFGSVSVYPNPSDGHYQIKSDWAEDYSWQIVDVTGNMVISGFDRNIDLSQYSDGLYLLLWHKNHQFGSIRIIKKSR